MNRKRMIMVSMFLEIVGLAIVWASAGFLPALGLYIFAWGMNVFAKVKATPTV